MTALNKNACEKVTKESLVEGCYFYTRSSKKIMCSVCKDGYYEKTVSTTETKCVKDSTKTKCYKGVMSGNYCNSCASDRGYYAVGVKKVNNINAQICEKAKSSETGSSGSEEKSKKTTRETSTEFWEEYWFVIVITITIVIIIIILVIIYLFIRKSRDKKGEFEIEAGQEMKEQDFGSIAEDIEDATE